MSAEVIAGRFEVLGPQARGNMGEVYRARDLQTGETVAVKVILRRRSGVQVSLTEADKNTPGSNARFGSWRGFPARTCRALSRAGWTVTHRTWPWSPHGRGRRCGPGLRDGDQSTFLARAIAIALGKIIDKRGAGDGQNLSTGTGVGDHA